jgi:hypothetical protein
MPDLNKKTPETRGSFVLCALLWKLKCNFPGFIFCGATAQFEPRPPRSDVSTTHTIRHTHPVGLLWTSDQLVPEAATYTAHNRHMKWTFMPSAGFEPAIPGIERPQTYAFDRRATGLGNFAVISDYVTDIMCEKAVYSGWKSCEDWAVIYMDVKYRLWNINYIHRPRSENPVHLTHVNI